MNVRKHDTIYLADILEAKRRVTCPHYPNGEFSPVQMNEQPSNRVAQQEKSKEASRNNKEPLRVKYISSPIMVSARSESEFRAVVQELTGKDSGNQSPSWFQTSIPSAAEGSRARGRPTPAKDHISNATSEDVFYRELDEVMLWREF
ncbi:hypothetical protein Ancab_000953 [Ancistrocladus abbreviatus]